LPKDITYPCRPDFFSNLRHNPWNIDLYMTNYFLIAITKLLAVNYNRYFIYNNDVQLFGKSGTSPRLQAKSLAGPGFVLKLNGRKNLPD